MQLLSRTENLLERLRNLKQFEAEAGQLERYATRHNQLRVASSLLLGLSDMVKELRDKDAPPVIDAVHALNLRKKVKAHAKAFKEDRKSCFTNHESSNTFWKPLEMYPGKVREAVQNAWKSYVNKKIPSIDDHILNVLNQVPGFVRHVEAVQSL
jgi:hypothetical protein